jgi:hypothetical protein
MKSLGRIGHVALAATFLALSTGIAAIACGGGNDNLPPPPPPPAAPNADAGMTPVATTPAAPATATPSKPPAPPVALVPGTPATDPPAPLPTVAITAPTKDQVIPGAQANEFSVKLDVKNWATAQGSSHVHLILDNKPYKAIYDPKQPVKLNELAAGEALAEGPHVLVAFPSRANHESVKTKGALAVVPFWIGKKGDAKNDPTKKAMLVYSRPKGDYKGELANHVLIDFYLHNVTLAEGKEHVAVAVNGPGIDKPLEGKVEKFGTPYYLENLQNGTYEIKLELRDKDGKPVEGPYNTVTRKINVDHDAVADTAAAHGDHAAADAGAAAPGAGAKDAGAAPKATPAKDAGAAPTAAKPGLGPGGSPVPTQTAPLMPTK